MSSSQQPEITIGGGRYRLLRFLGEGGMAAVFLALDTRLNVKRAIKVLYPRLLRHEAILRRFEIEAETMARLNHNNIVQVFDFGFHNGIAFLVMEYLEGGSLMDLLDKRGVLSVQLAIDSTDAMLKGLAYAHLHGVIHRDIKPDNLLFSKTGELKISDFGIAKITVTDRQLTMAGSVLGTPDYMAPEQLADSKDVGVGVDVYAAGATLYTLLSGQTPYRIHERRIQAALLNGISPVLAPLISTACHEQATHRYPSAEDMLHALQAVRTQLALPQSTDTAFVVDEETFMGDADDQSMDLSAIWSRLFGFSHAVSGSETIIPNKDEVSVHRTLASNKTLPLDSILGTMSNPVGYVPEIAQDILGRDEDRCIMESQRDAGARLITILGPGGMGKTSLMTYFGEQIINSTQAPAGGVWFCDITEATTAEGICQVIGQVFNIPLATEKEPADRLLKAFALRGPLLLLIDNAEQVISPLKALLSLWLKGAEGLSVIVTSRVKLQLSWEKIRRLKPLSVESGVELFVQRTKQLQGQYKPTDSELGCIQEIVRRLDGLPLAITLAASRMEIMRPKQILQRLGQRLRLLTIMNEDAPRHSALRRTIQWSWDLLSELERKAFAQLSVFRGGFDLQAAETVIDLGANNPDVWVMDIVQSLLDKSLIHTNENRQDSAMRFGLYESLRVFALEQLDRDSNASRGAKSRLVDAVMNATSDLSKLIDSSDSREAVKGLVLEKDNLFGAFEWAASNGHLHLQPLADVLLTLLQLVGPLGLYQTVLARCLSIQDDPAWACRLLLRRARMHRSLGQIDSAYADAIDAMKRAETDALYRSCLYEKGQIMLYKSSTEEGRAIADELHALAESANDKRLLASSLQMRIGLMDNHDPDCEAMSRQVIAMWRKQDNRRMEALAHNHLGVYFAYAKRFNEATEAFQAAIAGHRLVGSAWGEAMGLFNVALLSENIGRFDQALKLSKTALSIAKAQGYQLMVGMSLSVQATTFVLMGKVKQGLELMEEASAIITENKNRHFILGNRKEYAIVLLCGEKWAQAKDTIKSAMAMADESSDSDEQAACRAILSVVNARQALSEPNKGAFDAPRVIPNDAIADEDIRYLIRLSEACRELIFSRCAGSISADASEWQGIAKRFGVPEGQPVPESLSPQVRLMHYYLVQHLTFLSV